LSTFISDNKLESVRHLFCLDGIFREVANVFYKFNKSIVVQSADACDPFCLIITNNWMILSETKATCTELDAMRPDKMHGTYPLSLTKTYQKDAGDPNNLKYRKDTKEICGDSAHCVDHSTF
jgi:hypothetical protein